MADTVIYATNFSNTGGTFSDGNLTGQGTPAWTIYSGQSTTTVSSGTVQSTSSTGGSRGNARPTASITDAYAQMRVKFSRTNVEDTAGPWLRILNLADINEGYVRVVLGATGRVRIIERKDGVTTTIYDLAAGSEGSPTIVADTFYSVRIQVLGTAVTAIVAGTTHTATTTQTGAGTSAFVFGHVTGASSTVTGDDFEWGTYAADGTTVPIHLLRSTYYPAFA